jgi:hypothetical protein
MLWVEGLWEVEGAFLGQDHEYVCGGIRWSGLWRCVDMLFRGRSAGMLI